MVIPSGSEATFIGFAYKAGEAWWISGENTQLMAGFLRPNRYMLGSGGGLAATESPHNSERRRKSEVLP